MAQNDPIKSQLDRLWDKVRERVERGPASALAKGDAAFEMQEAQSEALRQMRLRFEREKAYWEDLVHDKENLAAKLRTDLESERVHKDELKSRLSSAQEDRDSLVAESFQALELQKQSFQLRISGLESDLQSAQEQILSLKIAADEQVRAQAKRVRDWEEKESELRLSAHAQMEEMENVKRDFLERRRQSLEEAAGLEAEIRALKERMAERARLADTERQGQDALLAERDGRIRKLENELAELRARAESESEERRLAALERERQLTHLEEHKKALVEQLLGKETEIAALREAGERAQREKAESDEKVARKAKVLEQEEELLRKRREDWVDSIRGQMSEQLSISGRIIRIVDKFQNALPEAAGRPWSAPRPLAPPIPNPASQAPAVRRPHFAGLWETARALFTRRKEFPGLLRGYFRREAGFVFTLTGISLFVLTSLLFFFQSEGQKSIAAQKYLKKGNDLYMRGALPESEQLLRKAHELDPENSMIRNSYTLVLAEAANQKYRDGKLEDALAKTEELYGILPEDPDVLRLHGQILQALGKSAAKGDR